MTDHILTRAKAYAALVGGIVTAILTLVPADSEVHAVLVVVGVIAAGVITYAAPANKAAAVEGD
jgi:hypothetical protein